MGKQEEIFKQQINLVKHNWIQKKKVLKQNAKIVVFR